ncbi:nucleoside-diphosphate kinase [Trypanosoma theileri]|uniref:Nucleoside-diphosphate kinase n=1 Tax=Trypanosoma theileri TaxID=67003 RepID=A0A1X0NPH5_9TRYP|nr:nucleoside-diphosphate kinase [Trypanosoma theileri]ORC86089.1 nucleoside-diphosphate kinase [Trypanosoma theileri]
MVSALNGVVTKAALFVRPQYAKQPELLALTKYKLHEAGFIIIHEEFRRVNDELADTIAIQLDRTAFLNGIATPPSTSNTVEEQTSSTQEGEHQQNAENHNNNSSNTNNNHSNNNNNNNNSTRRMFTHTHATAVPAGPQELVGHVYLYVLAHRDCHQELLNFLDRLFADDDYTDLLLELQERGVLGDESESSDQQQQQPLLLIPCPLFCNATDVAAKQVVQLLFPRMLVHDVPNDAASQEYVQAQLKGALIPALVELSKAKPANPIRWLAERLLNTNTRAPPLISTSAVDDSN